MPIEASNKSLLFHLEKSGIIIYDQQINSPTDTHSFWLNDKSNAFIILGNNKNKAGHRLFDLAHEVGHLLLHQNIEFDLLDTEEHRVIENEANMFASMFLFPENEYNKNLEQIDKKGYKKREPLDDKLLIERPMKIKSIFKLLFNNNVISIKRLLDEMHVEIDFLSEKIGIEEDFLKNYLSRNLSTIIIEGNFQIKN